MDLWTEISLAMQAFLADHGLLAAFIYLLVEEAGVPIPVPGDFLMLLLGIQARQGLVTFWQAVVVMELATVCGSSFLYSISRWAGRHVVYRYGRYIRLSPGRLDRAEAWLLKHGSRAVFLGRLVPGLRIVTAVACGIFNVPARVFLPAMSVGAMLYIVVYMAVGYFFGAPVLALLERLHLPIGLLGTALILGILLFWVARARQDLTRGRLAGQVEERERRIQAGALAGVVATIGSTLVIDLVINVAGSVAFLEPGTIVQQTADRIALSVAQDLQPLALFVAAPMYIAVGAIYGVVYSLIRDRLPNLPDWAQGLVFAIFPLLLSLLVFMPILGLGFVGYAASGPVAAVGEVVRHASFGVLLGLIEPIFLARRKPRPNATPAASPAAREAASVP